MKKSQKSNVCLVDDGYEATVPPHPLNVKPLGNAYTANENIKIKAGLLAQLPDELITQVMEWLDPIALTRLGCTCKALYAFSRQEELWKPLFLRVRFAPVFFLQDLKLCFNHKLLGFDVLHQPFLCAHTSLEPYTQNIPAANAIFRLSGLTSEDFAKNWADKPFILTDTVRRWPVYQQWSTSSLLENYGDVAFRAETVDWPLKVYVDYMSDSCDESPLYLFDHSFVEKMDLNVGKHGGGHYWPPDCFGEDLFDVLENQRPDRRWLVVGPERSGSTFHKDPNATSAWNAVISGSKYWIMFPTNPSDSPPPGVYVSEDQSEVTSPLSIAEWLLGFHAEARRTRGCREGVCKAGEVLHVPSGWWHLVVNLSPSIAITQNFVPRAHLANALAFLRDKPDQVSGFKSEVKSPYDLFVEALKEKQPHLLQGCLEELGKLQAGKKRKWEDLIGANGEEAFGSNGFSFGFGAGDKEEVP
ncbi:MAG: hypothetical protein Q9166_004473 [cf. Caloplaca sp. 2 TL-2023]